jgi:hypothetical protein
MLEVYGALIDLLLPSFVSLLQHARVALPCAGGFEGEIYDCAD